MTFGATDNLTMREDSLYQGNNLTIWEYLISRLIGGNTNPTPFLTSFLSIVLPSMGREIFCGEKMNLKYS